MHGPGCRRIDAGRIHPATPRRLCGFGPFPGRELEEHTEQSTINKCTKLDALQVAP